MNKKHILALGFAFALVSASCAQAQDSQQSGNGGAGFENAYSYQIPATAGSSGCCGGYYDYSNANGNAKIIMQNFNQKLAAMQLAIIEAMRLSTGQLSGNLREQSGASHNLADQQDDRATVKAIEEVRMEAIRQATSGTSSCRVIEASRGGGVEGPKNEFKAILTAELGEDMKGEPGWPSFQGQSYNLLNRLEIHCQEYATKGDVDAGLCQSVGSIPDADSNASQSIFYKHNNVVSTYTPERQRAANAFLKQAFASQSYTPIDPSEAGTIEGREKAAIRTTQLARSSIAREVAADYIANRVPMDDANLTSLAQGLASKMQGFKNADYSHGVGKNDWMELNAKSFFLISDENLNSNRDSVVAIKDLRNIAAVSSFMQYEQYAKLEKIAVLLASILDIMVEQNRTDLIKR